MFAYLNQRESSLEKSLLKYNFRIKKTHNLRFLQHLNLFLVKREDGETFVYFKDGRCVRMKGLPIEEKKNDHTGELIEYETTPSSIKCTDLLIDDENISRGCNSSFTVKICKINNIVFIDCDERILNEIFKGMKFDKELIKDSQNETFIWNIINKLYNNTRIFS